MNVENMRIVEEPRKPLAMNPKKFGLWLFLATVVMVFASLTSAYIVRRAEGNWKVFDLPAMFYWTSGVIVLSSLTLHLAYLRLRKDRHAESKQWLSLTVLLGLAFLIGQYYGWQQLIYNSIYLVGNPSESFVYILSGLHGVHVVSAVVFLLFVWVAVSRRKLHAGNTAQMQMCVTYWHFLGGLWLYLFVFLSLYR